MSAAPRLSFRWNDELALLDEVPSEESDAAASCVLRALRVRNAVLVKRLPASAIDGPTVDFNILLSAEIENEQRLESGMLHVVKTLTCHHDRPGDASRYYYVALEHCDYNLRAAVERTVAFVASLPTARPFSRFDESDAPLLMWQTRRSVVRQLLSGVAFLHRTGVGPLQRIYHGNLKPANALLKNGIVKISEVSCYSESDAAPAAAAAAPTLKHSVSLRNLGAGLAAASTDSAHRVLAALQQAEFAPLLTPEYCAEVEAAAAAAASACAPAAAVAVGASLRPALPSTLSVAGRQQLMALARASVHGGGSAPGALGHHHAAGAGRAGPAVRPPLPAGGASQQHPHPTHDATDRQYRLLSYGDSFALGCLAFFALTLGQHPFGSVTVGAEALGTASPAIARGGTPSAATLSPALLAAARNANASLQQFFALLQEGVLADAAAAGPAGDDAAAGAARSGVEASPVAASGSSSDGTPTPAPAARGASSYVGALRRSSTSSPGRPAPGSHLDAIATAAAAARHELRRAQLSASAAALAAAQTADTLDHEEAADLAAGLLSPDTAARLTPAAALAHPFFWRVTQKFILITLISESTVVEQDRATGEHAAFAADIQARFLARLPRGVGRGGGPVAFVCAAAFFDSNDPLCSPSLPTRARCARVGPPLSAPPRHRRRRLGVPPVAAPRPRALRARLRGALLHVQPRQVVPQPLHPRCMVVGGGAAELEAQGTSQGTSAPAQDPSTCAAASSARARSSRRTSSAPFRGSSPSCGTSTRCTAATLRRRPSPTLGASAGAPTLTTRPSRPSRRPHLRRLRGSALLLSMPPDPQRARPLRPCTMTATGLRCPEMAWRGMQRARQRHRWLTGTPQCRRRPPGGAACTDPASTA